MAVKGITSLRAQRITRAKPRGLQTIWMPLRQNVCPDFFDQPRRRNDFKSIFPGVTRARDQYISHAKLERRGLIFLQLIRVPYHRATDRRPGKTGVNELAGARPLQSDSTEFVRRVL